MKYKQFIFLRDLTIIVFVALSAFLIFYLFFPKQQKKEENKIEVVELQDDYKPEPPKNNSNNESDYKVTTDEKISAVHEEIIKLQKEIKLYEGKPDDKSGGLKFFKKLLHYQVDLRCDKAKGFDFWNRVKIDWDFDKKWDEKWDFRKNGSIKRQCSTNDDEVYDITLESFEGKWKIIDSSGTIAKEKIAESGNNSPEYEEIFKIQKNTALSEGKNDDNNGGLKFYKKMDKFIIDLRCDKAKGFEYWNRAKIDWDKDKKWDVKLDFAKDGTVKRQISSKDDENYDLTERLVNGKWVKN